MSSYGASAARPSSHASYTTNHRSKKTTVTLPTRKTRLNGSSDVETRPDASSRERRPINRTSSARRPALVDAHESSFIAESSFAFQQNPLNSRLGVQASPAGEMNKVGHPDPLKGMPVEVQEAFILEDLLFVLMGIPGTYITYRNDYDIEADNLQGAIFVSSDHLDTSLRDLVDRMLPLATYYTAISSFIELRGHTDYGLVNHALCAALRDMLKDYLTLVAQLEHAFVSSSTFTLQKLWFYVHPTLHTLSILYSLIIELVRVESPDKPLDLSSEDSEDEDDEDVAEAKALGLDAVKAVYDKLINGSSGGLVKGGEVVSIIWERMRNVSGDPTAHEIYRILLHRASVPYIQMLHIWTTTGDLRDPYDELMIKETKTFNRDTLASDIIGEYWEKRYTLRDGSSFGATAIQTGTPSIRPVTGQLPGGACIPPLLQGWKHKILLAGKYLNVIRECGIEIETPKQDSIEGWTLDGEAFFQGVEDGYTYANQKLLTLLTQDQQLLPRLRAMKNYFLLSQSSFLTHFLELVGTESRKPRESVSLVKLQSLLGIALNLNFSGDEVAYTFKDDVTVVFADEGLYDWLYKILKRSGTAGLGGFDELAAIIGPDANDVGSAGGGSEPGKKKEKERKPSNMLIDYLSLNFTVPFPLSLVISTKTTLRYQLLFRFLLQLHTLQTSLAAMWIDHTASSWRAKSSTPEFESWRRQVLITRASMLVLVQQMLAYVTTDVIEKQWRRLEVKLENVVTVDQLLKEHIDFLETCMRECTLWTVKLLRAWERLVNTCNSFYQYTAKFDNSVESGLDPATDSDTMANRWRFLNTFQRNFWHHLKLYRDYIQLFGSSENPALLSLAVRLQNLNPPSKFTS